MRMVGQQLLQSVSERIIKRYLLATNATGVMLVNEADDPSRFTGVDLVYTTNGRNLKAKVKPDTYFGIDPRKIADQDLVFYRSPANAYAFETISDAVTRDPGWMFNSMADELFYYFFVLGQSEEDVSALLEEPDEVFFSELAVERDELHVLPMQELRAWFDINHEHYMPRPVLLGDHSAWYRIIPIADVDRVVAKIDVRGSIFSKVAL